MGWNIFLKESAIDDFRWFGKKDGRLLLDEAEDRLSAGPLAETEFAQGEEYTAHHESDSPE